ncbi:MAG: vWA domain-containing protein, partial [Planctomycetota bacterium]
MDEEPGGAAGLLAWVAVIALVGGVFWIYRREGRASLRIKYGLAALRALMLIAAVLVILEPILAIDRIEEVDKSTVIILDDSLSLSAKDRYADPALRAAISNATRVEDPSRVPRFELVNQALQNSGLPGLLAKQNEVKVFAFSDGARPHATLPRSEEGGVIPGIDPTGVDNKRAARGTNIAGAIRQVVEEVGSDRIAAIVLVSDGRSNLGPPPADVALFLNNKDLKLHTVAVGEALDPRNLRAVGLAGPDRVFKNDPVALEAQVAAQGYGAAAVEFERRYTDGSDDWETIKSEQVAFEAKRPVTLRFTDRAPRVGVVEYRIRMDKRPDESTHQDNEKSFVVRVIEEKVKVLFVAGAPAHEYYAIKNTLLRDSTITVA